MLTGGQMTPRQKLEGAQPMGKNLMVFWNSDTKKVKITLLRMDQCSSSCPKQYQGYYQAFQTNNFGVFVGISIQVGYGKNSNTTCV